MQSSIQADGRPPEDTRAIERRVVGVEGAYQRVFLGFDAGASDEALQRLHAGSGAQSGVPR